MRYQTLTRLIPHYLRDGYGLVINYRGKGSTLKLNPSPLAVNYQREHGLSNRWFGEMFDKDLAEIASEVNLLVRGRCLSNLIL